MASKKIKQLSEEYMRLIIEIDEKSGNRCVDIIKSLPDQDIIFTDNIGKNKQSTWFDQAVFQGNIAVIKYITENYDEVKFSRYIRKMYLGTSVNHLICRYYLLPSARKRTISKLILKLHASDTELSSYKDVLEYCKSFNIIEPEMFEKHTGKIEEKGYSFELKDTMYLTRVYCYKYKLISYIDVNGKKCKTIKKEEIIYIPLKEVVFIEPYSGNINQYEHNAFEGDIDFVEYVKGLFEEYL